MKEELVNLYDEYLEALRVHVQRISQFGGFTSIVPTFDGFINWIKKGYID